MLNRQTISKLRREMTGLNDWPMSSSYPQDSGQREFKEILRSIKTREEQDKVNTTLEVTSENKWNVLDCCSKMSQIFWNYICGIKNENSNLDEVDGGREDLLKPLVKLYFLKILFIDIGISLGDVVTDLAQGINLIFDHNWNIQWSTFHYGLTVLVLVWLPLVPLALHVVTFRKAAQYYQTENKVVNILVIAASIIFFPLVPTFMYVRVLMMKRSFTSNRNKLKFLEIEQKATELKSIVGSIESPLQFILMLWLMFRGILTLPWDQPLSSSCVEDSLGRVACLPSIPMLSMLFSLLSILKSVFDLNMSSVSSASLSSLTKSRVCQHLVLCFFPFYLCNILFRLPAYAFILTFIDIWSIIPGLVLYVLQLALCGLFFIRQEPEEADVPLDNIMKGSTGTINQATTDDQGRSEQALVWDGQHWTSKSIMETSSGKQRQAVLESDGDEEEERRKKVELSEEEDETSVKTMIDELNTPVFFNSLAGCFFPCVYTLVTRQRGLTLRDIEDLVMWNMKVIMFQSFLFNLATLSILLAIFILVTFIESFNYKTNIFHFSWFCAINSYFVVLGVSVTLWSTVIYPRKTFPLFEKTGRGEERREELPVPKLKPRRRHLTGESNTDSVHSAASSMMQEDEGAGGRNKLEMIYCLALSVIVLLPPLLGVLVYKVSPGSKIYLVQVNQSVQSAQSQSGPSSKIFTQVIGSYDSAGFQPDFEPLVVENFSVVEWKGDQDEDRSGLILYIDHTREDQWRISSPKAALRTPNNYFVKIRKADFDVGPLDVSREIGVTRHLEDLSALTQLLTVCSDSSLVHIVQPGAQRLQVDRKYLFDNGSVIEVKTFAWQCSIDGHPCNLGLHSEPGKDDEEVEIGIECSGGQTAGQLSFTNPAGGGAGAGGGGGGGDLQEQDTRLLTGRMSSHCCHNSSHIIRFYGDQCDNLQLVAGYLHKICKFSHYFDEGTCGFNGVQTRTQICRVYGLNCVLKRSFQVFCKTQLPLEGCLLDEFSCV